MRFLWLTLCDPEPRYNGQFVYSGGLIDAIAGTGAEVVVLGLARPGSQRERAKVGPIEWQLARHEPRSPWASLASPLPHVADRCCTPSMRRMLRRLLEKDGWDAIVFDGISVGWALELVRRRFRDAPIRPKLVYVSHNHEETVRAQIAGSQRGGPKRWAARLDARKVAGLERALVDSVDLVTAITPEDGDLYRARRPDRRIDVLTPGYCGRRVGERCITGSLPRRAVLLGSFDWIAKRMNLEEFIDVADPVFARAGLELQVVGSAEPAFLDRLRKRVAATEITGTVETVTPYLDCARIAVVPERNGGGFKLKVLDYVFNRIPVLALSGSIAGMPLRDGESVLLYENQAELANGILEVMDDLDLLNRLQDRAFARCRAEFDWPRRGRDLASAVAAL
jgi:glycosyltransferase involved in cell wall biosynthesis